MNRQDVLDDAQHWVIKIGSAVFLREARRLDRPAFAALVEDIAALVDQGIRVTVVSSGAVALGREHLGWPDEQHSDIPNLQAYAAVGQSRLMRMWAAEFGHHGKRVAQLLFSRGDLDDRKRFLNARMTLNQVEALGVIPIINENDTVATEELRFGDNDQLAAMTCGLVSADVLVILSDVEAVYEVEAGPDGERRFGERIAQIGADDPHLAEIAGPSDSGVGRGGMISKVDAAHIASRVGAPTIIASGKHRGILTQIARGEDVGTLITPAAEPTFAGKKVWLGAGARPVGRLRCDAGAVKALEDRGASLLPSGVTEVEGDFPEGAVVELVGPDQRVFARGVAVYRAEDISQIAGRHSDEIEDILGFRLLDTVVHRDSLVLL
jgi:glutamate 5-kinase